MRIRTYRCDPRKMTGSQMIRAIVIASSQTFRHPSRARAMTTAVAIALASGLCAPAVIASGAEAERQCTSSSNATQLSTEMGSAGVIANLTNRSNSIRAISHRMLTSAIDIAKSKKPEKTVIFSSIPELSKKTTGDEQMCARHEQETKKQPIEFNDIHFESTEALTEWIMDFTQGKGSDGESLYKQCPGECSPQYTWWIEPQMASNLNVQARVVCGMPRDHSSDLYRLTTALAPACSSD